MRGAPRIFIFLMAEATSLHFFIFRRTVFVGSSVWSVVMTTPLLRELRRNIPHAWITLVVKPDICNLVQLCPYVDEVLIWERLVSGRMAQLRRRVQALVFAWKHLWRHRFDVAIVPRSDVDYYDAAFLAYFSGATVRLGYSEKAHGYRKEPCRGLDRLHSHLMRGISPKHEVERGLDMLRIMNGVVMNDRLELWLDESDLRLADEVLLSHAVRPDQLLIGVAPGAGAPRRAWPVQRYAELAAWLCEEHDACILAVGGKGEERLGRHLVETLGDRTIDVIGQTTLRQTAALLKRCHFFVGNDTGPMHLAAAMGVPIVEISCHPGSGSPVHPNSPLRFGPWEVPCVVVQPERPRRPCSEGCGAGSEPHCILEIGIKEAQNAILEILVKCRLSEDVG